MDLDIPGRNSSGDSGAKFLGNHFLQTPLLNANHQGQLDTSPAMLNEPIYDSGAQLRKKGRKSAFLVAP